jgi:hypothetical protein
MRTLALMASVLAAWLAADGQAPVQERFASDLALEVGEVRTVTPGPVRQVICDAPGIVEIAATKDGNGFRGLAPGSTTCSLVTADGVRRIVSVVVKKPDPARRAP